MRKTAVIVDDERLARNELKKMLVDYPEIEVVGEAANVDEARKIIDPEYEYDRHYNQGAEHCAFAIRARGET